MSQQKIDIRYRCLHPSCCVNCREGYLTMNEELFKELSAACEEGVFKSPRGACRLGYSQMFKIVSVQTISDAAAEPGTAPHANAGDKSLNDPISILIEEHRGILKLVVELEDQVRRRDVDGLWITTNKLENALHAHSALKEEEVLFPGMRGLVTFGEGLVSTIKEDHREVLSLLHTVRDALRDNEILDGIVKSMIVSLKGHIRKEDAEFFELVSASLDHCVKGKILEGMSKVDKLFVPAEAGDRKANPLTSAEREQLDEAIAAVRDLAHIDGGCCN
jgi:hemerythrin-like domain-containing protein